MLQRPFGHASACLLWIEQLLLEIRPATRWRKPLWWRRQSVNQRHRIASHRSESRDDRLIRTRRRANDRLATLSRD